ncbi:MAG: hypothetical protein IJO67_08780 [Clostridia bacterium]|nr:hypothetical protein [Clostridia bacterium]
MTCTHKKSIFLLVFVLLVSLMMPLAAAQEQPVQIFAQWTDDWGQPQTATATPIPYAGYENSYWLQLPEGVTADRAALYIQDTSGMYSSFSVPNGTLLDIVLDAGIDLATAMPLEIMAFTNDGQTGPLFNLYVSSFPLPREPGAPVIMPARITVRYLDSQTFEPVATETRPTVEGGTHPVYPEPRDLKLNYQLSGDGFVTVTVDEYGAHPDVVDFYYDYVKAPVEPVDIIIRYRDIDTQQEIASATSKTAYEGPNTIEAAPYDLPAGYVLESSPSAVVTVTEYGADMPELTFYYRYEKPEVKPVTVTIYYVDESNMQQVATPTTQEIPEGTWPVTPAPHDLQDHYVLSSAPSQDVTVN